RPARDNRPGAGRSPGQRQRPRPGEPGASRFLEHLLGALDLPPRNAALGTPTSSSAASGGANGDFGAPGTVPAGPANPPLWSFAGLPYSPKPGMSPGRNYQRHSSSVIFFHTSGIPPTRRDHCFG